MFRRSSHLSLILVAVFAVNVVGNAQEKCSVGASVGTYVVKCNGYLTPGPNAPMVPATGLAKAVADKDGNWSGSGTLSLGGAILSQKVQSVRPAQVNPDCTGTFTIDFTDGRPPVVTNFVVVGNGSEIDTVVTSVAGKEGILSLGSIGKKVRTW